MIHIQWYMFHSVQIKLQGLFEAYTLQSMDKLLCRSEITDVEYGLICIYFWEEYHLYSLENLMVSRPHHDPCWYFYLLQKCSVDVLYG